MFHRVKSESQDAQENDAPEVSSSEKDGVDQSEKQYEQPEEEETTDMSDEQQEAEEQETTFAYQRPATPAPARNAASGGYPGTASYTGGATPFGGARREVAAPTAAGSTSSSSERRLTIGAGITMSGEIESCDYLLVEGTVEAALKGANVLEIAESGTFYGTVEIGEANIAGRFEGDITVHGRLTISASGTVTGSIVYKELELEAGAVIDGKLTPLSALANNASSPKKAQPAAAAPAKKKVASAPAKAKKESSDKQEPANSDEGLFSRATAAAE